MELTRGSIINYNNKLFYVYGINGNIANVFEIEQGGDVLIDKTLYKLCLNQELDIDIKNDQYIVIGIASIEEMNKIKELRKDYSKKQKRINENHLKEMIQNDPTINNDKLFKLYDIVSIKHQYTSRYLVVGLHANRVLTIDVNELITYNRLSYNRFRYSEVSKCINITSLELELIWSSLKRHQQSDQFVYNLINKKNNHN